MMRILSIVLALILSACGNAPSGVGTGTTTSTATSTATTAAVTPSTTPTQIGLSLSATSVKTDGSDRLTITATVLDAGNGVVENATVTFASTGGQLSSSSVVTDVSGHAAVDFSSGVSKVNQTATITATVSGTTPVVTGQVPVQIVGTTVALNSLVSVLSTGATDTLTVIVKDAYGQPVYNTPVVFSQTGAGSVSTYSAATNTDVNGQLTATVSNATTGSATLTVTAAGATATQVYTVSAGTALAITSPTTDPYDLTTGKSLPITVSVPTGVTSVTFAASIGVWNGGTNSVLAVPVTGGKATANLSSTQAGVSTIQVYDTANIGSTDSMTVSLSQPAANANTILLQTNVSVLAPSTGSVSNLATLTATVLDAGGQVVGGAGVLFSIAQGVGGGEKINNPVAVLTNSVGKATAIFSSGSVSTGAQGVDIYATVIGSATTIRAARNIVIGGQAASLTIGRSNLVTTLSNTEYSLSMSVMVADGNGNPAANTIVSLSAFPKKFSMGKWANADPDPTVKNFFPCITGTFSNEDINRNVIMDVGDDVSHTTNGTGCDIYGNLTGAGALFATNSKLDPPSAAAGIVPATVTTDSNGIANFDIVYLKANAPWIETEIIASTQVVGTETKSSFAFVLIYLVTDGQSGFLPPPTFGK